MKHRGSAAQTGLGGGATDLISGINKSNIPDELLKEICKDCHKTFSFEKFGYCEAGFDGEEARFGVEPTYQFDPLKLIIIAKEKGLSRYVTGRAVGAWASVCQMKVREYRDCKNKSKFVKFIDKWHEVLFKQFDSKDFNRPVKVKSSKECDEILEKIDPHKQFAKEFYKNN